MRSATRALAPACAALAALLLGGCGSGGSTSTARAPAAATRPATGTLRVFAYEDTIAAEMLRPFKAANPGADVETASFDSDQEAAAKLRAGFSADVVEVCADEAEPLLKGGLLRPIDTSGVPGWKAVPAALRRAKGVTAGGRVYFVPLSAGPEGLIYDAGHLPRGISSFRDLFSPALRGRVSLEGDEALPPMAETALALGMKDPMNLSDAQVDRVKAFLVSHRSQFRSFWQSDSDVVNLLKSGEIVAADGGRGLAQAARDAGVDARWRPAREGVITWVCGLGITSKAKNLAAAYRLINYYASPAAQAIRARNGYVVTNPAALRLVEPKWRRTADPAVLERAIPESRPANYPRWVRAFQEVQSG